MKLVNFKRFPIYFFNENVFLCEVLWLSFQIYSSVHQYFSLIDILVISTDYPKNYIHKYTVEY